LNTWGLECRQHIVDLVGIDAFLKERYRHYQDDIPHDDPFPVQLDE
jgi:hypothetical protein